MPSFASHIVVAKLVKKRLHLKNSIVYYQGTILPDLIDEAYHYKSEKQNLRIPEPRKFLKEQKTFGLFSLGYYVHLLLDQIFLEEYVSQEENCWEMFLDQTIYQDYSLLHQKLCEEFHISSSWLRKILNVKDDRIERQKREKHFGYVENQITTSKLVHLDYTFYVSFLRKAVDKIVAIILTDIRNNQFPLEETQYMTLKPRILKKLKENPWDQDYYKWENRIIKVVEKKDYSVISLFSIFNYPQEKDLMNVTNNLFVQKDRLKVLPVILEGTDGVGKSTVARHLLELGYMIQDRSEDVICKYLLFSVEEEVRIKGLDCYLAMSPNIKVIFLTLNDEQELKRRIYSRNKISDYDEQAYEYNGLYEKTYEQLKQHANLYKVDCKNKNEQEIVSEVLKILS